MSPWPRNTPHPCLPACQEAVQPCQVLPGRGLGGEQKPQLDWAVGEGRVVLPGQMSVFAFLANVLVGPAQWP